MKNNRLEHFKGYAVGGDDTEWRKYITGRISDITGDLKTSTDIDDIKKQAEIDKKLNDMLRGVQNITKGLTI